MAKRNGEIFDRIFKELQRHSKLLEHLNSRTDQHSTILERLSTLLAEHSTILKRQSELLAEHSRLLSKHSELLSQHSEILGELLRDVREIKYELKDINRHLSENVPSFGDAIIIETTDGTTIQGKLKRPAA